MISKRLLGTCLLWLLSAAPAPAHFLFVRITPPAEGGRAAEVYFSELAEAGDPRFVDKIAHTKLWAQTSRGSFQPLVVRQASDRLRAALPGPASVAVIGACEYGVLKRKTPFLLRHFPKAIAGTPKELNQLRPCDRVPLEIMSEITENGIHLTVLRTGKPLPGARLHLAAPGDMKGLDLEADDKGTAIWKPAAPGHYSSYTSFISKTTGTHAGQPYDEVRDFATLALHWPLGPAKADPAAVTLFQEALAARAHWQDFPGFSAQISGSLNGRPFSGTVTIQAGGTVQATIANESAQNWVQEQLESIALHRGAGGNARSTGKSQPHVYFADKDVHHPLGRLIVFEGGRFASSYRIKDRQIIVVNRHLGKENMTITVLENDRNREGGFLPRSYTVQYWDAKTGRLKRTETTQESWRRRGSWDLPAGHTLTIASDTGLAVRSFVLSRHRLLTPAK